MTQPGHMDMETRLTFPIRRQPDDVTCGPTCLHAVYEYWGDRASLRGIAAEIPMLETGGTLAGFLAVNALRRGYSATIYTYNLKLFDPTWFTEPRPDIAEKLRRQAAHKRSRRLQAATAAYLDFFELGGDLRFEDLTRRLIREHLQRGVPILTGLSATYLHRTSREYGDDMVDDDVRGDPSGHFVVLCGYDSASKTVLVADPLWPNPVAQSHHYPIAIDRVIGAILLGIVTYDANLLLIEPRRNDGHREKPRRG